MRRGALISFVLHASIVLALIITFPSLTLQAQEDTVDIDMVGPQGQEQQALAPNKVAAAANTQTVDKSALAMTKPKPLPFVAPPPPPPPPPPAPEAQQTPKPPQPAAPPPPPTLSPNATPTPPPPPQKPQKITSTAVQPKTPLPPKPVHPRAAPKSVRHQPQIVKTPAPLSQAVLNTLLKLQSLQPQTQAPTAHYNPDQGGAPNGGGSPNATANSGMTAADRNAIGSHVRPCFDVDAGAPGLATFSVNLLVQTDASGTVHVATVAPQDQSKMGDPIFAAFAQDAINAVLNYQCATLPLPSYMLGQNQTLLFNFTPGD